MVGGVKGVGGVVEAWSGGGRQRRRVMWGDRGGVDRVRRVGHE